MKIGKKQNKIHLDTNVVLRFVEHKDYACDDCCIEAGGALCESLPCYDGERNDGKNGHFIIKKLS